MNTEKHRLKKIFFVLKTIQDWMGRVSVFISENLWLNFSGWNGMDSVLFVFSLGGRMWGKQNKILCVLCVKILFSGVFGV